MPGVYYRVLNWLNPVGDGAMGSYYMGVYGVAKKANAGMPSAIVNELVCGHLGRALRLPIPPGFLVQHAGEPYHVSLDFTEGEKPPPASAAQLVAQCPGLATGIVVFDAWVLNDDRHDKNLAFNTTAGKATLFDHSHAFLGGAGRASDRLNQRSQQLAIGGHCLAAEMTALVDVGSWIDRIKQVPRYFIEDVLKEATGIGLHTDDVAVCRDFLMDRANRLAGLIDQNRGAFPKVPANLWQTGAGAQP